MKKSHRDNHTRKAALTSGTMFNHLFFTNVLQGNAKIFPPKNFESAHVLLFRVLIFFNGCVYKLVDVIATDSLDLFRVLHNILSGPNLTNYHVTFS